MLFFKYILIGFIVWQSLILINHVIFGEEEIEHFKIGLMAPWERSFDDFSGLTSASAVSIALENIHADPVLGSRMNISVVTRDTSCDSKVAVGNIVKMFIEDNVDAIIGPPCSSACRPVAELASFWNIPIISWVATDPDFKDKSIFTTLGRTLGPFDKMAVFLVEILKQYSWDRVVILSSDFFLWQDVGKAVRTVFKKNNITIAYSTMFGQKVSNNFIRKTLDKTKEEGRIVFLISPKSVRRRFLLEAHDKGMTDGDYVFYTLEMLPEDDVISADDVWAGGDGRDDVAKMAFEAVFHVTLAGLSNADVNSFRREVAARMLLPPWSDYIQNTIDKSDPKRTSIKMNDFDYGDKYSPFLYDAMYLYAIALNETIAQGGDPRNGAAIASNMRGKNFKGMSGSVILDDNGDREPDYWISDLLPNGSFVKIAEVINTFGKRQEFRKNLLPPRWPGGKVGHELAPPDTPPCGFRNELCKQDKVATWIIALVVLLVIAVVGGASGFCVYIYRKVKFESDLLLQSWKINYSDLEQMKTGSKKDGSTPTLFSNGHSSSSASDGDVDSKIQAAAMSQSLAMSKSSHSVPSIGTIARQIFTDIARYKGTIVALKHIKKEHIQLSRKVLMEFNEIKDLGHENLNVFVGACIDPPNICIVWHYCSRGSLLDVIENDGFQLDANFKFSFMSDLANGMIYLHSSQIGSHGNLKDSNCLIDSRWTLKITDYGMPSFLSGQFGNVTEDEVYKKKLWHAPEILRENFPHPRGTPKGDAYSFAIVAYEIMTRSEPYCFDTITPRDVVNRVRNGESIPYRPIMPDSSELGRHMINLIKTCWDESPERRPTFMQIRGAIRKITKGDIVLMDSILKMMEKYSYNLEEIVEERTQQLVEEKKKTDRLLYRMLPSMVAEQLKLGKCVQPENFDQATIYFSDIVGFTGIAAESTPMQIVDFLNDLYTSFDDIIAKHDVYKVETIGDAYMVASGVPVRNGIRHACEIANVSLDLLSEVTHFKIRHRPQKQLLLRIGLHSGPVVAGVVGLVMPRYCLFGDTVNMAARMESSGKPLRIHLSKTTYIALVESSGNYELQFRGEMNVKGKGLQTTYWLIGKKGYDKPLPAFDRSDTEKDNRESFEVGGHNAHPLIESHDSNASQSGSGGMPQVV